MKSATSIRAALLSVICSALTVCAQDTPATAPDPARVAGRPMAAAENSSFEATLVVLEADWSKAATAKQIEQDLQATLAEVPVPDNMRRNLAASGPQILFASGYLYLYRPEDLNDLLAWLYQHKLVKTRVDYPLPNPSTRSAVADDVVGMTVDLDVLPVSLPLNLERALMRRRAQWRWVFLSGRNRDFCPDVVPGPTEAVVTVRRRLQVREYYSDQQKSNSQLNDLDDFQFLFLFPRDRIVVVPAFPGEHDEALRSSCRAGGFEGLLILREASLPLATPDGLGGALGAVRVAELIRRMTHTAALSSLQPAPEGPSEKPESSAAMPSGQVRRMAYKVFSLQHIEATAAASIVSQLFGRDSVTVAVEERGNALIVRGDEAKLAEIEALLLRLDSQPTDRAAPRSLPAQAQPPADVESHADEYRELEKQAARTAAEYQQLRAKQADSHPQVKALKERLRQQVAVAFEARQQWQNVELDQLRARLAAIEQSLAARERIKDTIINRRVEELLDTDLRWEPQDAVTERSGLSQDKGLIGNDDHYSRVYPVGELLGTDDKSEAELSGNQAPLSLVATAALKNLVRQIEADVLPDTWKSAGGSATIEGFPTNLSLVVSHTAKAHQAVEHYLNELREKRGLPKLRGGNSAAPTVRLALEGFCPVTVADMQRWSRGRPEYSAEHQGKLYLLADEECLRRFRADPIRYVPAAYGCDVVLAQRESRFVDGNRRHGMRFRDRTFLFQSETTLEDFCTDPATFYAFAYPQESSPDAGKLRPPSARPDESGALDGPSPKAPIELPYPDAPALDPADPLKPDADRAGETKHGDLEKGRRSAPYVDSKYEFSITVPPPWTAAPLQDYAVPGVPRAAYSGPRGASIVLFVQESGKAVEPRFIVDESAKSMEQNLKVTVHAKDVRPVAGKQATWLIVEGRGTGAALDGNSDVPTTQHWVAIPREKDIVVALLTCPSADFAENEKGFEESLRSLAFHRIEQREPSTPQSFRSEAVKKWDWLRASTAENTWKNVDSEVPVPIFSQPLRATLRKIIRWTVLDICRVQLENPVCWTESGMVRLLTTSPGLSRPAERRRILGLEAIANRRGNRLGWPCEVLLGSPTT